MRATINKEKKIFFNHSFDKKRLKALISWIFKQSGEAEALKVVDLLKETGFKYATKAGISIGLHDLTTPIQKSWLISESQLAISTTDRDFSCAKITATERSQRIIDTWHRASESLSKQVVDYFGIYDRFNPVYIMALSGARGNFSQVRQLIGMRGLMADQQGKIVSFPIRSNLREGLTLTEYFISCSGARKGLVDTALRTADTGYLTRRLVDVSHHVVVKRIRCNTNRGIVFKSLQSYNKIALSLKERLVGRVLAENIFQPSQKLLAKKDQEISLKLSLKITEVRDKVYLRSPLTCGFTHSVCQLCYGWSISQGTLVALGDAVGVIAAQSIGEPGTQLTMRTFHTGGVFSGDLLQEIRAPHAGKVEFSKAFQGLLIRTAHGRIAFLSKTEGHIILNYDQKMKVPKENEVFCKQNIGSFPQKKIENVKKDPSSTTIPIPPFTMLFIRQGEKVEHNQLLAEFSIRTKEGNQPIKTQQTIFALLSGRVIEDCSGKVYTKAIKESALSFDDLQDNKIDLISCKASYKPSCKASYFPVAFRGSPQKGSDRITFGEGGGRAALLCTPSYKYKSCRHANQRFARRSKAKLYKVLLAEQVKLHFTQLSKFCCAKPSFTCSASKTLESYATGRSPCLVRKATQKGGVLAKQVKWSKTNCKKICTTLPIKDLHGDKVKSTICLPSDHHTCTMLCKSKAQPVAHFAPTEHSARKCGTRSRSKGARSSLRFVPLALSLALARRAWAGAGPSNRRFNALAMLPPFAKQNGALHVHNEVSTSAKLCMPLPKGHGDRHQIQSKAFKAELCTEEERYKKRFVRSFAHLFFIDKVTPATRTYKASYKSSYKSSICTCTCSRVPLFLRTNLQFGCKAFHLYARTKQSFIRKKRIKSTIYSRSLAKPFFPQEAEVKDSKRSFGCGVAAKNKVVIGGRALKNNSFSICKAKVLSSYKSEDLENDLFRFIEPITSGRLGFLKILATRVGANLDYISPIKSFNAHFIKRSKIYTFIQASKTKFCTDAKHLYKADAHALQVQSFALQEYLHPEAIKENCFFLQTIAEYGDIVDERYKKISLL